VALSLSLPPPTCTLARAHGRKSDTPPWLPGTVVNGAVSRPELSKHVVGNDEAMKRLEGIVHPLVEAARRAFIAEHSERPLVVLDIPLLFETKQTGFDEVVAGMGGGLRGGAHSQGVI
jgi:hypothetical protein